MNNMNGRNGSTQTLSRLLARAFIVAGFLFTLLSMADRAVGQGVPNNNPIYPLDTWSFYDSTNWTSDNDYFPVSFTNLAFSHLGDGASLAVNTNVPAWLQYNVYEKDSTTNLTVDSGTVLFWFAPDWASTNLGGTGPGEWGRLFEVGGVMGEEMAALRWAGALVREPEIVAAAEDTLQIGYHATAPANVDSILANGLYDSAGGRLGGAGVYVNNTPEGAIAEYMSVPGRPAPTVLQVQYSPGLNYTITPPPAGYTTGPLPFAADTLTTESLRLPGTLNTIIRNGSATVVP